MPVSSLQRYRRHLELGETTFNARQGRALPVGAPDGLWAVGRDGLWAVGTRSEVERQAARPAVPPATAAARLLI